MSPDPHLKESAHFCMLPWVHLHVWPEGRAFPCCMANASMPIGDLKSETLAELWNSEKLRRLRLNMLENKPSRECKGCYALEKISEEPTLRQQSNERFKHHWSQVESTAADGVVPKMLMAQLDIRFSNLCNFRCHTCGPALSSAWFEDAQKMGLAPSQKILDLSEVPAKQKFWAELEPLLAGVEAATFAGGEPLLSEDHYRILDLWTARRNFDVKIQYITNFSELSYKGRSVIDSWKRFPHVKVAASLDASGGRAEYLRKGTVWKRIVENRELMLSQAPEVGFEITPTLSLYNVEHFPDFHLDWVKRGLLEAQAVRINLLSYPPEMNLRNLPTAKKKEIAAKYRCRLEEIVAIARDPQQARETLQRGYGSVIELLTLEGPREDLRELNVRHFRERTRKLDALREESLTECFPELAEL